MATPTDNQLRLLVMKGDGIGPEITDATLHVLNTADRLLGLGLAFETTQIGLAALRAAGTTLPPEAVDKARAAAGVILGPVSHHDYPPAAQGGLNPSGELRKRLDLYANIRPARARPGAPPRCGSAIDLGLVGETPRGLYPDRHMFQGLREVMPTPDRAVSVPTIRRA